MANDAANCMTQEEADAYLDQEVGLRTAKGVSYEEALQTVKFAIGCATGYYDDKTAERMFRLFKCKHPVFGRDRNIDPEDALEAGKFYGENLEKFENLTGDAE